MRRRTWEALHESLARQADSLEAHRAFKAERQRQEELAPFEHPVALIDYLTSKEGDLDRKDRIYAALLRVAQSRERSSELASTLLWLGLWPALDATYNRFQWKYFQDDPAALVSEIGARFTQIIHHADLDRIHRVAATLQLNVQRDIVDGLKRQWRDDAGRAFLPSDDFDEDVPRGAVDHLKQARARLQTRGESALGLSPILDVEEDVGALRAIVAKALGGDADAELIIGAAILEENQRELAERLGLTHEAARKRVQRALSKLRDALEKSS